MTIALVSTGGLFTRLGSIIAAARTVMGHIGASTAVGDTNDTGADWGVAGGPVIKNLAVCVTGIEAQYLAADQDVIEGINADRDNYRAAHNTWLGRLQTRFANSIITQVNRDTKLSSLAIKPALIELFRQMVVSSDSVKNNTVTATTAAPATNTGTGWVVCGVLGPDGKTLEYCYPEVIRCTVTGDAGHSATLGSEPVTAAGTIAAASTFDYLWPLGSAATASLTTVDPAGSANRLTNGTFEVFTVPNLPDGWVKIVGTVGTSIKRDTANTYNGSGACVEFVGDGAELTEIAQTITGLAPNTVYAFQGWVRTSTSPNAGVLKFALTDTNDAIINDDAGNPNSVSLDLTAVSTSYVKLNGTFRTPKTLTALTVAKFSIRVTTAVQTGHNVFVDWLAMTTPTQLYVGGPYLAAFRGSVDFVQGDYLNVTIAQNLAGTNAVAGGGFQSWFDRFLGMRAMSLQIPSAGSPTIAEALIV